MNNENLKRRTKQFGLDAIALVKKLPRNPVCDVLGKQLLRSATSVGANYRAACRAKSPAHFISKIGDVEEEADESGYWLEMLFDSGNVKSDEIRELLQESNELVAIMVSSINTAKKSPSTARELRSSTPHSALRIPHSP